VWPAPPGPWGSCAAWRWRLDLVVERLLGVALVAGVVAADQRVQQAAAGVATDAGQDEATAHEDGEPNVRDLHDAAASAFEIEKH
jgi:hypothetical protein